MGMLEDIMKTLERVPGWKRIAASPARLDALEARIAELEEKLRPSEGTACPKCRQMKFRITSSRSDPDFAFAGLQFDRWQCAACDYQVERQAGG